MRSVFVFFSFFVTLSAFAQIPEDAVRFSWQPQVSTARLSGAGSVGGSVGGDLSSTYINPAGLAFYRTGEAVFSPLFKFSSADIIYRGNPSAANISKVAFAPTGVVFAHGREGTRSDAFSLSVAQTADFRKITRYSGFNNYSSYAEKFADEFAASRLSIDAALNTLSPVAYGAAPALYTFLIDTVRVNGNLIVRAAPENVLQSGGSLKQDFFREERGGMYEINAAAGVNTGGKWLFGASLGVPIINYESTTIVEEADTSANTTNGFNRFRYDDNYTTKGIGINIRAGVIYRPADYIRLGLAVHSPTFMTLADSRESNLTTTLENPPLVTSVSSQLFTNNTRGRAEYFQTAPWRALLSASYVFREVDDVTKQKGFFSVDAEYQQHSGSRFSSNNEEVADDEKAYYKQLNGVVKNIYKGAFNLRAGGELKFKTIMTRLGIAYYGAPYEDKPAKANRTAFTGGLGYRNKGWFADVALVYSITNDFDIPYRLSDALNVFAASKTQTAQIVFGVGVKF